MPSTAVRRLRRILAASPIGALIGVGLTVIPITTVQAEVVHHTKAGEVSGPLERTEVRQMPFPTRHAALYWTGNPDAQVTVSFSRDRVTFGEAFAVEHDEVGMQRNNGQTYGAIIPAGDATVARITTDRPLGRITVLALAAGGTSVEKVPVPGRPAGSAVIVQPRIAWGADENLRFNGPTATTPVWPPVFQTVQKVAVHHTAGANGERGETAKATIQSMYYYHAVTQGWGDIGYNFLIDDAGVVYKGRSTSSTRLDDSNTTGENTSAQGVTAGHAYGYNSGSVGIALLGNFVGTMPSGEAEGALKSLLIDKLSAHGLDPHFQGLYTNPVNGTQVAFENVPGHQEVPDNATECPGGVFLTRLKSMRDEVALVSGTPDTAAPANSTSPTVTINKRSVKLTWTGPAADNASTTGSASGLAGYDVWRSSPGKPLARVASTTASSYTDTLVGAKTTYSYYIKTYDGAGNRSDGLLIKVTA